MGMLSAACMINRHSLGVCAPYLLLLPEVLREGVEERQ